jgi:acetolactate synthase-1/2/3 large subunit
MGYALPGMIGARWAAPEKRIIGVSGDGCLLMALSDLTTWLDAGGPSVLMVLNDSEYGMIAQTQANRFSGTHETSMRPVNFASLTETLGGAGFRVETPDQLEAAIEGALSARRPALIDVVSLKRMGYPTWN